MWRRIHSQSLCLRRLLRAEPVSLRAEDTAIGVEMISRMSPGVIKSRNADSGACELKMYEATVPLATLPETLSALCPVSNLMAP